MTLDFHYSFGFRNSKKNLAFYRDNTVVFAAGKLCALFDINSGVQSYFQFAEKAEITAIVRCGVLIAGAIKGSCPSVCLFNPLSETRKVYSAPSTMESEEFVCLAVSVNLKFLAAQGGPPDWLLVIWFSQTREIAMTFNPTGGAPDASVHDISFHAAGRDELVVVGSTVFKLYEYQKDAAAAEEGDLFNEIAFEKFEAGTYYSIGWPEKENLAVGSSKGEVLIFRGIEMVREIIVEEDIKRADECDCVEEIEEGDKAVTSVILTPQLLLCAFAGLMVLIYEGEDIASYTFTKFIFLPTSRIPQSIPGELKEKPDRILNITISLDLRDLVATTRDGQLLYCREFAKQGESKRFRSLIQGQHDDSIIGVDVSKSRPLIVTCSLHSLTLWNYSDKKQDLRKMFKNEINSVSVHPTGLYVALGFDHYCRIFSVLYSDLRERELIPCKNCSGIGFSTGGHLLAIVSDSIIKIYSFITFALLVQLDGHAGLVTSFDWMEHDTRLVSCDDRGVVCKWDLVSSKKLWENTAVLTYYTVAGNSLFYKVIAVGSDRCVRCFDGSLLQWVLKRKREVVCALYRADGRAFYLGTSDGCIEFHAYPTSNESSVFFAHCGKVAGIKYNFGYDFLITAGSDGFIFMWKVSEGDDDVVQGIFSKLCLVDSLILREQADKSKQLVLSLQHTKTASDCEFELSCIRHEGVLRTMALDHEHRVEKLSKSIAEIKENMQTILFDFDTKNDLKELEMARRQEIIDATFRLNEAYRKSGEYANETKKILLGYEDVVDSLTEKHARFSCAESNEIKEIADRIKVLETTILYEKEISKEAQLNCEEYRKKTEMETDMVKETNNLKGVHSILWEDEVSRSNHLRLEIEKLIHLTKFQEQDSRNRRNITAGQVDYDIIEKINTITLARSDYEKLESIMEAKDKSCQKQEIFFCEMRKVIGSFKKQYTVSNTAIDELTTEINDTQSKIKSARESIEVAADSIPSLKEEIGVTEDLCSSVTDKVVETVDGYQNKVKLLRDTLEVIYKYTSMLHQCLSKECDPVKLRDDIMTYLEENKTGFFDDTTDVRLLNEYDFQIGKLRSSYHDIKGEPTRAARDKSLAEFRLSQENAKILREVHKIQKDAEKLRVLINEMETALGMQAAQARGGKHAAELRYKIEFVIEDSKRNKDTKKQQIAKLDMFIEEQQKEIERFHKILAEKSNP